MSQVEIEFKNCRCGVATVKTGGCNLIKCKNMLVTRKLKTKKCGIHWCWECGLSKSVCHDPKHKSHS